MPIGSPSPVSPSGLDDSMYMAHQAAGTAMASMGPLKEEVGPAAVPLGISRLRQMPELFDSITELLHIIKDAAVHPIMGGKMGDDSMGRLEGKAGMDFTSIRLNGPSDHHYGSAQVQLISLGIALMQ